MSKTNPEAPGTTPDASYTPHEHEEFKTLVRIDTPQELKYYQHGGILQYVLRQLLRA